MARQRSTVDRRQATQFMRRANDALAAGRLREAKTIGGLLLEQGFGGAEVLALMARVHASLSELDEAESFALRCLELTPGFAASHTLLADILFKQGRLEDALARYDEAIALDPSNCLAATGRATICERLRRTDDALAALQPLIDRGEDDADVACRFARIEMHRGNIDQAIEVLRRRLEDGRTLDESRRQVLFVLGRVLERCGRYEEAFEAYAEANATLTDDFVLEAALRKDEERLRLLSPEVMSKLPRAATPAVDLVFIVGMPRCGSTLTELILDAHPLVHGLGEHPGIPALARDLTLTIGSTLPYPECVTDLEQSDVDAISRGYVEQLRRIDPEATCFVDKHLTNERHLGLIALLFPNARVVWCRRDPLDNCLACFGEPLPRLNYPYASDLYNLGVTYRQIEQRINRCRSVLDIPILVLSYETLVSEPEPTIRSLVEFCGLPWDDACLRHHETDRTVMTLSYEQVRQPVHTSSVGRAARFEQHLGPLREGLDVAPPA